jgi:lipase chaperone LimK
LNQTHAQTLSSIKDDVTIAKALTTDNDNSTWAFYADEENKKYFIDFEKLHIYLDRIEVMDEEEKVVFTDNLWNLPADALYELDCSKFTSGKYTIRLKSLVDETMIVNIDVK